MPIQPMGFRKLETDDVNPYNNALQTGLQNYVNTVKAQYLPQQTQADILSKAAYATYTPYGYLSKALSDPTTMLALLDNPSALKNITNMLGNIPTNPMQSLQTGFGQSNKGGGLWDWAKGLVSGQQPAQDESQGSQGGPPMSPEQAMQIVQDRPDNQNSALLGNNIPPMKPGDAWVAGSGQPPQQVPPMQQSAPAGNQHSDLFNARLAQLFPNSPQAIDIAAKKAAEVKAAEIEPEANRKMWTDTLTNAQVESKGSQEVLNSLEGFHEAYQNLSDNEKGFLKGRFPAASSNAQNADQFAKMVSTANAKALVGGRITNNEFQIADSLKPGRYMNKAAEEKAVNFYRGKFLRDKVVQPFYSEAHQMGLTVPQADTIWNNFIQDKPFYDPKTGRTLSENVSSWKSYLKNAVKGGSNESAPASQMSMGAKLLGNNFQLPQFESKEQFQSWFNRQPKMVQDAVNAKLGGR